MSESITPDDLQRLERELHHEIPLSEAMGVRAVDWTEQGLQLGAPLAPNLNHKRTAFGGSVNSLATLACWGLMRLLLRADNAVVVIQDSAIDYLAPIDRDFCAIAAPPETMELDRLRAQLRRRGIARITLAARVYAGERHAADFQGRFVAYRRGGNGGA